MLMIQPERRYSGSRATMNLSRSKPNLSAENGPSRPFEEVSLEPCHRVTHEPK